MTYVEWLRVRNVLRCVAIILAVLIVVSLVLRISFNKYMNDDEIIRHISTQPGTTISHTVLPDGTKRTIIKDPKEDTTATIDDVGGGGRQIVVDEPQSRKHDTAEHVTVGSVEVNTVNRGDRAITTINTNSSVPFIYYMFAADCIAFFIATFLAAPFARENDGHLEIALTKPISRTALALQTMGVDLIGIVLSSLMTIAAFIICQSMFEIPHFTFDGVNWQSILMGIAFPFAWYALLVACTSSMKRGYGAILGLAWPVAILLVILNVIPWGDSLLGQLVHGIFWTISRLSPLSYIDSRISVNHASGELLGRPNFLLRLGIETLLFLVYSALAVFQWRRVEA
jgi:hypothetical protein